MYLELLHYNNYYNRIAKYHDDIGGYLADDDFTLVTEIANVNFNPNDGISTEQVVNNLGDGSVIPDYAFLFDREAGRIVSRWFVIEASRTRSGQYKLVLYRDVIADWREQILNAPTFIEKATLTPNDPLIFNAENMTYNQIKTSETLLMDETKTPWIVGYVANSLEEKTIAVPSQGFHIDYPGLTAWEEYDYAQYTVTDPYEASYAKFNTEFYFQDTYTAFGYQMCFNQNKAITSAFNTTSHGNADTPMLYADAKGTKSGFWRRAFVNWQTVATNINREFLASDFDFYGLSYAYTGISRLAETAIADEEGKIVQVGDKFYKIHVHNFVTSPRRVFVYADDPNAEQWKTIAEKADVFDMSNTSNTNPYAGFAYTANAYYITKEEINADAFTFVVDGDRNKLTDAPYSMFAMPARELGFTANGAVYRSSQYITYRLAQSLITELGSELYDIQLLPYCPLANFELLGGNLNLVGQEDRDFVLVKDTENAISGFVLWLTESSFTRRLNFTIPMPSSAIEVKVANECDRYRIVSPTYNGEFEFSAAKNGGVSGYNVFATYKPYTPFIKVAPIFSGLYGEEFQDARGCVCQGDFSLPQIDDKWVEYQLQNKNYLNSFYRQIENLDANNNVQRELEMWNVIGNAASAGVATGIGVGMINAGVGVVMGVAAGVGSLAAGFRDIALNEQLRTEARDYTIDQFNYNLGNIQALPYSLANVGAQTIVSKLFPFVEYYTCTDTEKDALRDKVRYDGMTVGKISNVANYLQEDYTYIKGRLVRLEGVEDDFHVINVIADEINKGVFIKI